MATAAEASAIRAARIRMIVAADGRREGPWGMLVMGLLSSPRFGQRQGAAVGRRLEGWEKVPASVRIAIIGSGPAGLSAAARAARLGLSHVLLEKSDHLSDTIYKYQKGKHVMATPGQLVLRAAMDFEAGKREAVLGTWDHQAAERKVNVKLNAEVKKIAGQK